MNRILTATLTAVAVATLFAMSARADVIWQYAYEGDVLPENATPAWSGSTSNPMVTTDGSVLTINSTNGYLGFNVAMTTEQRATGLSTVEFRVDVSGMTATGGNNYVDLRVGNGLSDASRGDISIRLFPARLVVEGTTVKTGLSLGFHVIRTTVDTTGSTPVHSLYLDGATEAVWSSATVVNDNSSAQIAFAGRQGSGLSNISQFDYVRWTFAEATAPSDVPEPASMTLLALGGLIALRRRR